MDNPHFIFQHIISGEMCFERGDKVYRLQSGEGFFCNTHDHDIVYYYPPNSEGPCEFYCWCFLGDDAVFREIYEKYGPIFRLPETAPSLALIRQYEIRVNKLNRVSATLSEAASMALTLLNDLIGSIKEEGKSYRCRPLVRSALNYLQETVEQKHSVNLLAEHLGVSRVHLNRLFRQETGLNPQQYINQVRMKHAAHLLKSTNLSVKEVAYRMNFDTPAHFIRSFKKYAGMTPGSYRKN